MAEDPSVLRNTFCSNSQCAGKKKSFFSWCPDLKLPKRYGIGKLQNTLKYYPQLWNVKCVCGESRREDYVSNTHVFLDLDTRLSHEDLPTMWKLYDIPTSLTFNCEYRLAGIVVYDSKCNHYSAYCRRRTGSWEIHNGMESKIRQITGNPQIHTECAIYIMKQNDS